MRERRWRFPGLSLSVCRAAFLIWVASWFLSGCTTGFFYNRLDTVTVWYLDRQIDLTKEQRDQVKAFAGETLEWHRINHLPRIEGLLRSTDSALQAQALTPAFIEEQYELTVVLLDEFLVQIVPGATQLLSSLSDEQIAEYLLSLEEDNQELFDDFAGETEEERIERRRKATLRGVSRFTGRLSDDQKALIDGHLSDMHDLGAQWIENRRVWQASFRDLLEERPPRPEYEARLENLLVFSRRYQDSDYWVQMDDNRRRSFVMLADLFDSLSDKQSDRFSRRLNNLADDVEALADKN